MSSEQLLGSRSCWTCLSLHFTRGPVIVNLLDLLIGFLLLPFTQLQSLGKSTGPKDGMLRPILDGLMANISWRLKRFL